MDTLDTIIRDLTSIAQDKNYTGPTTDAMIYLLANGIYKNNLNAVVSVLEASASRCKLLNSAIQHAMDKGYSVNRGTNQHIIINNLLPAVTKTVKKYDQALKVNGLYLYYAKDYQLENNASSIEFIVGEQIIEEELTSKNSEDQLCLASTNTDFSQELSLYLIDGQNERELSFVEIRRELLKTYYDTSKDLYWLLTAPDYGVEFYRYTQNILTGDMSYNKFDSNVTYKIKGVKYTDKTIDPHAIKEIPGLKVKLTGEETTVTSVGCIPREESIPAIYLNALKAENSDFMIRATDDIDRCVLAMSGIGLDSVWSKYYPTIEGFEHDHENEESDIEIKTVESGSGVIDWDKGDPQCQALFPGLCIYYHTDLDNLPNDVVSRIRNQLVSSFYVTDTVFISPARAINITITLKIEYTELLDITNICNKVRNEFNHKLGVYMSKSLIQTVAQKDETGIYNFDSQIGWPAGWTDEDATSYQCKPWEYFNVVVIQDSHPASKTTR